MLHPPPGVQVVSFFVTARYKGQDDRDAFTDVLLEQLADLLGEPIPAYLTDTTREHHLLRMLTEAAGKCQRLILVVDGLDEDRGVTIGPDAHSIAALLPTRPATGLQVIVAGRHDPPIPADVPDDHPLRDPAIVRVLAASRWAAVVKADMQRELKRLLHGSQAERDLLGLVAAAGGGLSAGDLAELTGLSSYEIEENLHAVAGRTFTTRAAAGDLGRAQKLAEQAMTAARAITNPDWQAQIMGELARAAAEAGDLDWAEAAALAIIHPGRQARALADLARKAKPAKAPSLLARALTTGHWLASVDVLVHINPAAVIAIADEYLSAAPSPGTSSSPAVTTITGAAFRGIRIVPI